MKKGNIQKKVIMEKPEGILKKRSLFKRSNFKFNLLEKSFFFNFLKKSRLIYYPRYVNLFKNFSLFKSKNIGVFNLFFTFFVLRRFFKEVMEITQNKGLFVVGGLNVSFLNLGKKLFYSFDKWYNGFITNFVKVMRHTLINTRFKKVKEQVKLLPLRIVRMKKILQIPSYNFLLQFQHFQLNEGSKLKMLQTTVINDCQLINNNFTKILTINDSNSTKNLLIFFIKECIIHVKKNMCKNFLSLTKFLLESRRKFRKNRRFKFFKLRFFQKKKRFSKKKNFLENKNNLFKKK